MNTRVVPVEVGDRKQLFLEDDFLVESAEGVRYVLHQPTKSFDPSFPGNDQNPDYPGFVLYDQDEGVYKRWYGDRERGATAYATSEDGTHWEKADLDVFEYEGSTKNNLLMKECSGFNIAVLKTPWDENPEKRYRAAWSDWMLKKQEGKYVLETEKTGLAVVFSPDGVRWTRRGVVAPGHFDSHNSVFWDDRLHRYVAFVRAVVDESGRWRRLYGAWIPVFAEPQQDPVIAWKIDPNCRRAVGRLESDDFVTWRNPQLVLASDEEDPPGSDLQNPGAFKYSEAENAYFMTTCLFDWRRDQQWAQLAFSRDGFHWQRAVNREPFIPLGPPGSFDSEVIFATAPPYIVDDRLVFFYTARSVGHDRSAFVDGIHAADPKVSRRRQDPVKIGHASLRLDGFISIEAGSQGRQTLFRPEGFVTTHPLTFEGSRLTLNVSALNGDVRVEVLDIEGKVLPGFSVEDCDGISTDSVRHEVTWKGKAELDALQSNLVKLRFYLTFSKLYAFQFGAPQAAH